MTWWHFSAAGGDHTDRNAARFPPSVLHSAGVNRAHACSEGYAGHANIETTATFYLKTSDDDAKRVRAALDAVA